MESRRDCITVWGDVQNIIDMGELNPPILEFVHCQQQLQASETHTFIVSMTTKTWQNSGILALRWCDSFRVISPWANIEVYVG